MTMPAMPGIPDLTTEPPAEPFARPVGVEEPPKRQRGRPKNQPEAPPEPPGPTPEDIQNAQKAMGVTFKAASVLAAGRWGSHWVLSDEDTKTVGDAWGAAVAPYLSKLGPATPFLVAAMVTWSVIQPKIAETARQRALTAGPMTDVQPPTPEPQAGLRVVRQAEPPRDRS